MGAFNIEILYLLTLHGVLYNRDSMTGNKGVTFIIYFCSVYSVRKPIENLMENDLDMSDLYLSQGTVNKVLFIGEKLFTFWLKW